LCAQARALRAHVKHRRDGIEQQGNIFGREPIHALSGSACKEAHGVFGANLQSLVIALTLQLLRCQCLYFFYQQSKYFFVPATKAV
jgi:hypothetical protein